MRIHAPPCAATGQPHPLRRLYELAAPRIHRWTEDPSAADLIFLDADWSPERAAFVAPSLARKSVVLGAGWEPPFHLTFRGATHEPNHVNPFVEAHDPATTVARRPDLLASFVGDHASDHPLHDQLFALPKDRRLRIEHPTAADPHRRFYEVSLRSKFILCPRSSGLHPAAVLAAMKLGIAPVILSDDWRPFPGPHWEEFAVFVAEDDARHLPSILAGLESTHWLRGEMAQEAYQEFFSPLTYFNHLVASAVSGRAFRGLPTRVSPPAANARRLLRESHPPSSLLVRTS